MNDLQTEGLDMAIDWNVRRYPNKNQVKQFMLNLVEDNMDTFVEILIAATREGNADIVKMVMPVLVEALYENKLSSYNVATLLQPAACMNNVEAMDALLQCYIIEPHKCAVPLGQAISYYEKKLDKPENIQDYLRYQIAFCYIFGIGVTVNHKRAMEFLQASTKLWENSILTAFLRVASDNPSIRGGDKEWKEFISIAEIIKNKEKSKNRIKYLTALHDLLFKSQINGRIIPFLEESLRDSSKAVKMAKFSINLFNAYKASVKWQQCLSNSYYSIERFDARCINDFDRR